MSDTPDTDTVRADFTATAFIEKPDGERTEVEFRAESGDMIEVAQRTQQLVSDEATIHCLEIIRLDP